MKIHFIILILLAATPLFAQFPNIELAGAKNALVRAEPAVIINHEEVGNIITSMGTGLVVYSTDGGKTWKESMVSSPLGRGGNAGMIVDVKGRIYNFRRDDEGKAGEGFRHLICHRSEDLGKTWNEGSVIGGESGKKNDKLGIAVNAVEQALYAGWTQYDQFPSSEQGCTSNVMFSMATNAGKNWGDPVRVSQLPGTCANDGTSPAGASPAVGIGGRIYMAWSNNGVIFFDRSYDKGKTWLGNDLPIAKQEGGWALDVPGFGVTHNLPVLMIDNSPGRYHGMIYLMFADQRNGVADTDIWFHRSPRHGDSWTPPVRVNTDDPGHHQFSPAMAIDQATGNIYIVYYDRRSYDDAQTDVYIASSFDGGNTFREKKVSEKPFVASALPYFDHTGLAAHNGIIVPVWTRIDDGKVSVMAAVIRDVDLLKK